MMKGGVRIWCIVAIATGWLNSCCLPQKDLEQSARNYYAYEKDTMDGMHYFVEDVRVLNVKKYSCDSASAYVRVKGNYTNHKNTDRNAYNFDKASRLTIVKHNHIYMVTKETAEN